MFADLARQYPILDVAWLGGTWGLMYRAWRQAAHNPAESDLEKRQASVTVITNQINAAMTAVSVLVAGVGAVLAIGLGKDFPAASLVHLMYTALWALFSIFLGLYNLGYISSPSVFQRVDIARKSFVQLAAFVQLNLILLAAVRFVLGLWNLSRQIGM